RGETGLGLACKRSRRRGPPQELLAPASAGHARHGSGCLRAGTQNATVVTRKVHDFWPADKSESAILGCSSPRAGSNRINGLQTTGCGAKTRQWPSVAFHWPPRCIVTYRDSEGGNADEFRSPALATGLRRTSARRPGTILVVVSPGS